MKLADKSCTDFIEVLASKAATPGGGGGSAITGAIGMALGGMVCNLTIGKKKYAQYDEKVKGILKRSDELQAELLKMMDADAECFLPLSKAYGMPKDTEEQKKIKEETLEKCLKQACSVPVSIVKQAYEAIKLHEALVDNCSKLAISDVGVGVQCLRAAIIGAQLNVIININSIKDQEYVKKVKAETEPLVEEGIKIADKVYEKVVSALSK
ncbi:MULTISPECIES: cyclodeaminase/cyclohydrolase family protein [Clostridium]|jgi:formiminotetrahydrofolate cyclodeaminase|uniref:Formyltetrahydrofolate cyclohydrolase n=5 Tax=Clostridium TaxID=1485 RepID=D8GTX7_CLOLD|nr:MULTISPECIES: cyclodeaminase/cyclohydrolase family protein [Clostridium]HDS1051055.1 cyclodeaminase/cyclohydrolase family protein [Pseudomonas putida]ADK16790.1 formyltetrahydrofolate cyclohydrolase [Clostridium ljungdahlii DSM 13528]AEI90750.1 formimido-tetrahydrofolate cyclodeaminase [Clostridium autoethanogenum DSM 10061]AEI90767.1 formimido-tetrahydrofolate cyclodeaminase [Clostridium ragsdalei P11]AGY75838.1 cyclodeaminase/cyclohydrolase family protein [Clostridium autoethanogenum DSM 